MTFQNLQTGRVVTAVVIIFVISIGLSFAIQSGFVMVRFWDVLADIDPDTTQADQEQRIQDEIDVLIKETRDGSPTINTLSMIQWGLTAVATFFVARRTARRNATSPEQAAGYGLAIGLGLMPLYGVCICSAAPNILVKVAFFVLIIAAAAVGGQLGGQNLGTRTTAPELPGAPGGFGMPSFGGTPGGGSPYQPATTGGNPETYYNMGVSAALGGRREEARQHFTRVLQMQPRHVPAWLQLANLADTPDQAWNYIQQARSINPTDPAVLQAVGVIWPQVAAKASQPPHAQPPYKGGQQDDVAIPRSTLPGEVSSEAPTLMDLDTGDIRAASQQAGADDADLFEPDSDTESGATNEPPPPPPPPPARL